MVVVDHFWRRFFDKLDPKVGSPTILGAGLWDSGHILRKADHSGGRFSMILDQKWRSRPESGVRPPKRTSKMMAETTFRSPPSIFGPNSSKIDLGGDRIPAKDDQNPRTRPEKWSGRPFWDQNHPKSGRKSLGGRRFATSPMTFWTIFRTNLVPPWSISAGFMTFSDGR